MASLASINVKFSADLKQFSSEMQNSLREIEKFGSKLQSIGRSMSTYITAPLLIAGAAGIKFASDYEESLNKVDAAFKGSSDQVKEFAKTSLISSGIAEGTALDLAATYGDMATSLGLSTSAAAKMSTELVGLAGDLSSFKNIGIDQANTALSAIFTGETESLKKLGIVMTEANLQAFAYSQGIQTQIKDMDQASKVNLRYAYIMSVTKNAQGDFTKTSGGAANQMRIFQESMKQLAQQFGSIILPVFTKIVNGLNEMIAYFSSFSTETKTVIVVVAAIAAAIGPLVLGIGAVISLMPTLIAGFTALTGPVGLTVVALSAVAAVMVTQWQPIKKILVDVANYFIDLYNSSTVFRIGVEGILLSFKNMWAGVKFVFNALVSAGKYTIGQLFNGFSTLGKLIKAALTFDLKGIKEALTSGFSGSSKNAKVFFNSLKDNSKNAAGEIGKNFNTAITNSFSKGKIAKITIPKESVDAKGVSESVSEGVVNGAATGAAKIGEKLKEGTVAFYEAQISKLEEQQKKVATTEAAYYTLGNAIAQIQSKIDAIAVPKMEPIDLQAVGPTKSFDKISVNMSKLQSDMAAKAGGIKASLDSITEAGRQLKQNVADAVLPALTDAFNTMGDGIVGSLGLAETGFQGFIGGLVQTITKLIAMMLSASISQSIAGATASGAATGPAAIFTTPAFIATAVSGVIAAFAAIPKFETGGVVGGTSFYGDRILARVNSGELILNQKQQQRLSGQLDSKVPINVSLGGGFVVDGNKLRLVLDRTDARKNRIG